MATYFGTQCSLFLPLQLLRCHLQVEKKCWKDQIKAKVGITPQNCKPAHVSIISKFNGNGQPLRREAEASATACAHTLSRALTSLGSSPKHWNHGHVIQSVSIIANAQQQQAAFINHHMPFNFGSCMVNVLQMLSLPTCFFMILHCCQNGIYLEFSLVGSWSLALKKGQGGPSEKGGRRFPCNLPVTNLQREFMAGSRVQMVLSIFNRFFFIFRMVLDWNFLLN